TEIGVDLEKKLSDVQRQQMSAIFSKFGESCEENWHQVMNEMANSRSGFDAWISKREVVIDQK
ncbi:MarR family transcriptional regulator, partial [Bacillus wiedmannii]